MACIHIEEEWRYALMKHGGQSVIMAGELKKPQSHANSLDILDMVRMSSSLTLPLSLPISF